MSINHSRLVPSFVLCLLSVVLLAACAGQAPAASTGNPTATVSAATPTPTANTVLVSFVGKWVTHDDQLTITANGAGVETWNAGPCVGQGTSGMCAGTGNLTFTVNSNGSLTGSYQSVAYASSGGSLPASYQPPAGYPVAGDSITLTHSGAHLLAAKVNGNNYNYCDPTALSQGQCGA